MRTLLLWGLVALLAVDCGAYVWGLRRWIAYLHAQRLSKLTPAARASVLSTPEYRRLRAMAKLPVTLAALLFVAMLLAARV
jgi:hypothetical protein